MCPLLKVCEAPSVALGTGLLSASGGSKLVFQAMGLLLWLLLFIGFLGPGQGVLGGETWPWEGLGFGGGFALGGGWGVGLW